MKSQYKISKKFHKNITKYCFIIDNSGAQFYMLLVSCLTVNMIIPLFLSYENTYIAIYI